MWLEFDSLVNARDVGGTPTTDGDEIRAGRLLRSDNLQDLTAGDIERLLGLQVTDVIDLRSFYELHHEGPGPLTGHPAVAIHHHSFIPEKFDRADVNDIEDVLPDNEEPADELPGDALPFKDKKPTIKVDDAFASTYLSFLNERPESVVAALRAIAYARGAALVHCAAGKDRTGTAVALSLVLAGADPVAVVDDYAASSERMQAIIDRLIGSETYRENLAGRPLSSHMTRPETMQAFLEYARSEHGSVEAMLKRMGWTDADTGAMWAKLRR
ncbi:tyrosine-protein phosphatase [Ammonicoccus fulvus]|uniref:Tyrosine-protein phosphatase n=1 Tax=Ammonicoccus fulvus TaxID=3138240 RepID=A0ABZ3FTC6_9ACTN